MNSKKNLNVPNWRLSERNQACLNNRTGGNYPNLRFPEFEGVWEVKKVGNIASVSSGGTPSRSNPNYWDGDIPWITTSLIDFNKIKTAKEFITDEGLGNSSAKLFPKGTILMAMYGQGKTRGKVSILSLDATTNQACAALKVNKEFYIDFVFNYLAKDYERIRNLANDGGQQNLSARLIKSLKIKTPSLSEQIKIADFLTVIDERITTQSKIIKDYKLLKKGLMQKIFNQELRFKDKHGNDFLDWEEKKLGQLTYKTGVKNKERLLLPVYSINNKEGFLPQSEQFDGIDSNVRGFDTSMYKIINKNTFAYNPARINVGSIGYSGELENIIISSLYVCFQTKQMLDASYLWHYMKTFTFNKSVLRNVEGGVRDYLFYENFSNIEIPLPSIKEQVKISKSLSAMDKKIELEEDHLMKIKAQKQFLLQNLFI